MKREEAIKDLDIIRFNPHWDELVNEEYWKELMEMAITALQNQPFWIPVSERLPEEPEENEIFDNKPLELYLVSIKGDPYPFRAFCNGKFSRMVGKNVRLRLGCHCRNRTRKARKKNDSDL